MTNHEYIDKCERCGDSHYKGMCVKDVSFLEENLNMICVGVLLFSYAVNWYLWTYPLVMAILFFMDIHDNGIKNNWLNRIFFILFSIGIFFTIDNMLDGKFVDMLSKALKV